jgi:hypothetical protein
MARQFRKLTKETVFEISRNYKTLKEFVKGDKSAYATALKNGWLDEITWYV